MNKPQIYNLTCSQAAGGRYIATHRMSRNGWVYIRNLHTSATLRVYINQGDRLFRKIRAQHGRRFQFDDGITITLSSPVLGLQLELEESYSAPDMDYYFADEQMVGNIPYCAPGIAITTTFDLTALLGADSKGYATYVQIIADSGTGFIGTISMSSDNGTTYSSPVPINEADPQKKAFEETRILTTVRVVRTAGTFTFYAR